jgi:hypothetical protein
MNINHLTRIANKSQHFKYQHCSLIYSGSRLITYGYNRTNLHAEIVAINRLNAWLRVGNSPRPRNLHMINFMIRRMTGTIGNSYPCEDCQLALAKANIKLHTWFEKGKVCQNEKG